MSQQPFSHARQKLVRSRKHAQDLDDEIAAYMEMQPYVSIFSERHAPGKDYQLNFTTYTRLTIPSQFACVLGDFIHNLRVALDVAANDIVALNGVIPKGVYFPFGTDPTHFDEQMNTKMKGASDDAKKLVRSLQPWRGGNDALRALHDLDIVDKHSAPLAAENRATTTAMTYKNGRLDLSALKLKPLDQSLLAEPYAPPDGFKLLGMSEQVEHIIVLANDLPLGGQPVVETLHVLAQLVDGILETFTTHLVGG